MKTKETQELEKLLFEYNAQNSFFCVFECTIGFGGGGRVDCISIDTHNCIRCYEIKVTKQDFHSKHGHNFVGNLNYYVMPYNLYKSIRDEIPEHIGVMCPKETELHIYKKSKNKEINNKSMMKLYIIRSLFRDYTKYFRKSYNLGTIKNTEYEKQIKELQKDKNSYYRSLLNLHERIRKFLGERYEEFRKFK